MPSQHEKQVTRLAARRATFVPAQGRYAEDKTRHRQQTGGYKLPGSMNPHKCHSIKKSR